MSFLLFTIIIPTYNSGKTIARTIQSILSQTYQNYEVMVWDGLSSDSTISIVKEFAYQDNRIKWYTEKDKGVYDAMNKGIEKANGEWLYFLGSDDYLYDSEVLQHFSEAINITNNEYQLFYGDVFSPAIGEKYDGAFDRTKITIKNVCHQAIFYHKDIFKRIGNYNLKYKLLADYDINLRCFLNPKISTMYVNFIVAYYEAGGISAQSYDHVFNSEFHDIVKKLGLKTVPYLELKKHCKSNLEFISLGVKRLLTK
jgi:glycosyltransferase involved in cell wall biosynthesis